jgi:hypothetical protein
MPEENSNERYDLNVSFFVFLLGFLVMISLSLIYNGIMSLEQPYTISGLVSLGLGALGLLLAGYNLIKLQNRLSAVGRVPSGPVVITRQRCRSCNNEVTRPFKEGDYIYGNGDVCTKCGNAEPMLVTSIFLQKPPKKRGP